MTPNQRIKGLAEELGCDVKDLLVLARNNDPYNAGTPAHFRDAEWFAGLVDRFSFSVPFHLRRMHYAVLSPQDVRLPDGTLYANTLPHWAKLTAAGAAARSLGFISYEDIADHRNPDPYICSYGSRMNPAAYFNSEQGRPYWTSFGLNSSFKHLTPKLRHPTVSGYRPTPYDQPHLIEVWIEKSTMNDVLKPLCRELNVNLVASVGFQSYSSAISLIKRASEFGKPAKVLYISDFDPAGHRMPIAVARQVQFQLEHRGYDAELDIEVLMLTPDQIAQYNLPKVPIKPNDNRKDNFESKHGEGAVELDALEALHPGAFASIVRQAITRYQDDSLEDVAAQVREEAEQSVSDQWEEATSDILTRLEPLKEEADKVVDDYQPQIAELSEEINAALKPINEKLDELAQEYFVQMETFDPDLPQAPEGEATSDPTDPLFSSSRSHIEQLHSFRRHGA
ncbi:MAG: hypothetical protein ABJN62_11335 [Halioglobus sp.]